MKQLTRRHFLQGSAAALGIAVHGRSAALSLAAVDPQPRGFAIYVDPRLGPSGESLKKKIVAATTTSPLLKALCESKEALLFLRETALDERHAMLAYNHLLLIGLPDNPIIKAVWQKEALISGKSVYLFGFGSMEGSIGYIESDRNPFLHAADVPKAPYEAQLITVSGTDLAAISLSVETLLSHGLCNGLVAKPGEWRRTSDGLLDRDPLPANFSIPDHLPHTFGSLARIALTQASEDEYRRVLELTQFLPETIWRAKYYEAGVWDAPGEIASFHNFAAGLHRRAYGNTLWAANFADQVVAGKAAPMIAKAARLKAVGQRWNGNLPAYAWGGPSADAPTNGQLELWTEGPSILISSILDPPNMSGGPA